MSTTKPFLALYRSLDQSDSGYAVGSILRQRLDVRGSECREPSQINPLENIWCEDRDGKRPRNREIRKENFPESDF
jgi:hypothetical protein